MTKGKHKTLDEDIHVLNTNSHKKGKKKNTKKKRKEEAVFLSAEPSAPAVA